MSVRVIQDVPPSVGSVQVDIPVGATERSSDPSDGVSLDINPIKVNDLTMAVDRLTPTVISE